MIKRFLILLTLCVSATAWAQLPDSYDLRSVDIGGGQFAAWVPDIQDQGIFSDCWTFASATAINSNLLMNGYFGAAVEHPPEIQISSWHLSTSNGAPEGLIGPNYGGNGVASWGGFEYQALGYVTRGSGIWNIPDVPEPTANHITQMGGGVVLNSNNPLNPYPPILQNESPANIGYLVPPAQQTVAFQTRSVTMLDQGFSSNVPLPAPLTPGGDTYNFDLGVNDPQVQAVKATILANGAVTTTMNADYNYFSYTSEGDGKYMVNYYNPGDSPDVNPNSHEVTIIGWDDNHVMVTESGTITGAWKVQNSWGKSYWTDSNVAYDNDGTFWASYNDPIIARVGVASFTMEETAQYSQTVIQNELGPLAYANNYYDAQGPLGMAQAEHTTVASILTPLGDGTLIALGLASQVGGINVTISLYSGWVDGPDTFLFSQDYTFESIGYQLVDLSQVVNLLSGDPIVIQLTYGAGYAAPIVIGGDGLNGYLDVTEGLSFYHDGSNWHDFASVTYEGYGDTPDSDGGILFLKGIVAVPEPQTWLLLGLGLGIILVVRRRTQAAC